MNDHMKRETLLLKTMRILWAQWNTGQQNVSALDHVPTPRKNSLTFAALHGKQHLKQTVKN